MSEPKKPVMFVSFSGGRTSAYMCWWMLENKADDYEFIFTFANTGQEHEKTLEFVDKCDKHFGLNLVWLEAVVNPEKGKGTRHKVVTYETASRNGEPLESIVRKYGLFNAQSYPHCTREAKLAPMNSYRKQLGLGGSLFAVGIRADEIDRMSPSAMEQGLCYPLITMTQATKPQIIHWWSEMPFDLEIPNHMGNCITCHKKSNRKLMTIAKHEPERFDFFASLERLDTTRKLFRGQRSTQDILEASKKPFKEFVDHKPELQTELFDPMDLESDCGAGCEIGNE